MVNFFFLDRDLIIAARYHGDKHLNKMVTEAAQIVSAALRIMYAKDDNQIKLAADFESHIYRLTHKNHPITKWALRSRSHYLTLCEYGLALGKGGASCPL